MSTGSPSPSPSPSRSSRRLAIIVTIALVVAVLAVVVFAVVVLRGRDGAGSAAPAASSSASPSPPASRSTSATASLTASATQSDPAAPADAASAVWPLAASGVRYPDPVAAARGFAVDFVGFQAPVLGQYRQGDSRSGEVDIRPTGNGPVTTAFVRQLGDGTWWVLGSATTQIRLDSPATGALVASPLRLVGAAQAFEGHVTVTVREDGATEPLASGFVTGRMDAMGPFDATIPFSRAPTHRYGTLLLTTESAENGQRWQAAVIRVRLTQG